MPTDNLASKPVPLLKLASFTLATVPPAASYLDHVIRITNGAAGAQCIAISDGTNWKVIAIGATAS